MSGGFSVEPAEVSQLATQLDGVGTTLYGHRGDLDGSPDAGRSSNEVNAALGGLAGALAGLAQHIGSLSDAAQACADAYAQTDQDITVRFEPR